MPQSQVNNLKTRSVCINNIVKEGRYNTEDISKEELAFIEKNKPVARKSRTDLKAGDVVVVLEGAYMGKKAILIKQLPECMAVVSGVSSLNGFSAFKIDERYLLKLSVSVELPANIQINADNLFESKMGEGERMESEPSEEEKKLEKTLIDSLSKIKFMKTYLAEPFKVDHETEFYSQEY